MEAALPEHQSPLPPERHPRGHDSILFRHILEHPKWVGFAGHSMQEIGRGNQVINIREKDFDLLVNRVEIGDYRNSGLSRRTRRDVAGLDVATVQVKRAGARDGAGRQLGGLDGELRVTVPEDCPLACGLVHADVSELALGSARYPGISKLKALLPETRELETPGSVVTDFSDVPAPQPQALAGDQRGRYLPASVPAY